VAKVGTSSSDRTISLKRLQCVVEKNNNNNMSYKTAVLIQRHPSLLALNLSQNKGQFSPATLWEESFPIRIYTG